MRPDVQEHRTCRGDDPLPNRRRIVTHEAPGGAMTSAWEALSWIAFNERRSTTPTDDLKHLVRLCANDSPPKVLEALEARAASEPYCALESVIKYRIIDRYKYSYN